MAAYNKEKTDDKSGLAVVADQFNVINSSGAIVQGSALTTQAQTITGIKTFGSMFRIPYNGAVAALGTNQATAAALSEGLSVVTGADGTVGVVLPAAVAGAIVIIKGTTSAVLKVYPATGAAINALSADGAISLASGVIPAIFLATSATQWYTIPLLPS